MNVNGIGESPLVNKRGLFLWDFKKEVAFWAVEEESRHWRSSEFFVALPAGAVFLLGQKKGRKKAPF